jgi:hypothetical protein
MAAACQAAWQNQIRLAQKRRVFRDLRKHLRAISFVLDTRCKSNRSVISSPIEGRIPDAI